MSRYTRICKLLKPFLTFLSIGVLVLTWQSLLAQETKKEVRLKIEKIIHGETVLVDTVFEVGEGEEVHQLLKEVDPGTDMSWFGEGKDGEEVKVVVKSGAGTWTTDEGVTIDLEGKGEMIFIHKDGEKVEVERNGSIQDGEGKEIIFIQKSDEMSEEEQAELMRKFEEGDLGEIMQEVEVKVDRLMDAGEGEEIQIHVVTRQCRVEDCGQADLEELLKTGKKREAFESGLVVDDLNFFPNPNDGKFRLNFNSPKEGQLELTVRDLVGKTVFKKIQSGFSGSYDQLINLADAAAGVYFLTISHADQALTKKIIIE